MDIPELLNELEKSISMAEDEVGKAQCSAAEASSAAQEAYGYASTAEDYANYAQSETQEALDVLSTLRSEYDQLAEQVEALIAKGTDAEQIRENPAHSDLQRDINKYKERVLTLQATGATKTEIAQKLEIGEFLVSRILESMQSQAA